MEDLFIDGFNVTLSNLPARVSDYTVYNGKIWKVVGSEGMGAHRSIKLERDLPKHLDELWVKGKVVLRKVIKPTGYIRLKESL